MTAALVVSVAVAVATFMVFLGIRQLMGRSAPAVERLQDYLVANWPPEEAGRQARRGGLFAGLLGRLNEIISRQDFAGDVAIALARANLRITVSEYVLMNVASVCIASLAGVVLTRNVIFAVLFGALGFLVPGWFLRRRQSKRLQAFESQLPDVLTLIVGSLRAGYSLLHSMDIVAEEVAPPASEEFLRVVREVAIGLSLQEALENLTTRLPSDDLSLIVTAINIQHEVGGNLATVLDTISDTIRERVRIQGEIRVMTTQQTLTGYILSLLPFILGVILYILNPKYMSRLFEPGWTLIIPFSAVVMVFAGFMVIRKIVAIDV